MAAKQFRNIFRNILRSYNERKGIVIVKNGLIKRRSIGYVLILTVLISALYTGGYKDSTVAAAGGPVVYAGYAYSTVPEVLASIDIKESENHTVDVSLRITPQYEMDILGMVFRISYSYCYGRNEFPFCFDADKLVKHTHFSDALIVANAAGNGTIDYYWDSANPVTLKKGEPLTLATVSLSIKDSAKEGEYRFLLECQDFYRFQSTDESGNIEMADVSVDTSSGIQSFWYGAKLESVSDTYEIIASGQQELAYPIYLNKTVSADACYVTNTALAVISRIENETDGSGSCIYVVGKNPGTTVLHIEGGLSNREELSVLLKVVTATPYTVSMLDPPAKTSYQIGEKLDLTGLTLKVFYNNYDVETVPYSAATAAFFAIGTYDFSTVGKKQIAVNYAGYTVYVEVTVSDSEGEPPDNPSALRGDMNGDGLVTDADAIYLLYHTFFPEDYPLTQDGDFNGDNAVTDADAIYLLYHTFFPADYPL